MLFRQKLASLQQVSFLPVASLQFGNGFDQPAGILRAPQQVSGLFQRLVVLHRHHDYSAFSFTRYRNGGVVVANLLHFLGKVAAGGGITYAFHLRVPVHVHKYVRSLSAHNKSRKRGRVVPPV